MDPRRRLRQAGACLARKSSGWQGCDGRIGQAMLWLQLAIEDRRSVTVIDEARAERMFTERAV